MTYDSRFYVLFVCTGNICRSPMAQGIMQKRLAEAGLVDHVRVDSAATHDYQIGSPPADPALRLAADYGIDISGFRARRVGAEDFLAADHIAAMDRFNIEALRAAAPPGESHKIRLLLEYAGTVSGEIEDPYGRPQVAYEQAFELIQAGVRGLMRELERQIAASSAGGR